MSYKTEQTQAAQGNITAVSFSLCETKTSFATSRISHRSFHGIFFIAFRIYLYAINVTAQNAIKQNEMNCEFEKHYVVI